ncbi:LysR family transcriptional regulator [Microbacterium sp. ET2]|uniref:LysR family transcriptional regulator n=1 Tax=Microbacterium albipurpureum TaxID=3050384 RepID=UPI00259D0ABD|nr:LysR family transcriptional regulator [Microbacterium sp. ET2 (Ac-2212)]WJL94907.1 LysR family transcriptional regulator [Microbacterium sp. ET2 (Ac-2212)]
MSEREKALDGPPSSVDLTLQNLNLNLLVSLDALLRERNVSAAARALGVSQPTASAALARLRAHFDDRLLVRQGREMVLTPLASGLVEAAQHAIVAVTQVFGHKPGTVRDEDITRNFRFASSDYGTAIALPPLAARIHADAPGATLTIETSKPLDLSTLDERLRTIDGVIVPRGIVDGLPHIELFSDEWVGVVSAHRADAPEALTMDDLAARPWVTTFSERSMYVPVMRQLSLLGVTPRPVVTVQNFAEAAPFIDAGPFLAVMQRRLAERMAEAWRLRILDLPFEPVPIVQALWWHPIHERDPEHRWLRATLADLVRRGIYSQA